MMKNTNKGFVSTLSLALLALGLAVVALFLPLASSPNLQVQESRTEPLGGNNAVGGKVYYLSGSGISASQTTLTLTNFDIAGGTQNLTMTDFGDLGCGTVEPGHTSRQEFVSFTGVTQNADGTAQLTGVTRGLAPIPPYTASTTLQDSHAGGSTFVISNSPPCFYEGYANLTQTESILGLWTYSSTTPPKYDYNPSFASSASTTLASIGFVASTSYSGTVDASETVKGIVELATGLEAASSTSSGSAARLVLPASQATTTPGSVDGNYVVVSKFNKKLDQIWLDLTEAFTWTGSNTFTNGLVTNASSSAATLNVENLVARWGASKKLTSNLALSGIAGGTASTTIFSVVIPGGTVATSSVVRAKLYVSEYRTTGGVEQHLEIAYGSATSTLHLFQGATGKTSGVIEINIVGAGATNSQEVTTNWGVPIPPQASAAVSLGLTNATTSSWLINNTATQDSTVNKTLMMVMRAQAAGLTFTPDTVVVEVIK